MYGLLLSILRIIPVNSTGHTRRIAVADISLNIVYLLLLFIISTIYHSQSMSRQLPLFDPLFSPDMIALPDFRAGAMENWGLITYRETAMLYEEGVSSETNLQRVDVVIAHELAHMVFFHLFC